MPAEAANAAKAYVYLMLSAVRTAKSALPGSAQGAPGHVALGAAGRPSKVSTFGEPVWPPR